MIKPSLVNEGMYCYPKYLKNETNNHNVMINVSFAYNAKCNFFFLQQIRNYCGENVQCELSSVKASCEDRGRLYISSRYLHEFYNYY